MGRSHLGNCHICGEYGPLTFEHVPPQAASNKTKVITTTAEGHWNPPRNGKGVRYVQDQGGHGVNTLCGSCNNWTGTLYGGDFVNWCRQGEAFYHRANERGTNFYFEGIRPLRIIKQIATMFLAIHGPRELAKLHDPLVKFVVNKEMSHLDPMFRFWIYFVGPGPLRKTNFASILDISTGICLHGFEFSFPPFGYLVTLDSEPPDPRLCEITGFVRSRHEDVESVTLPLALLPNHGPFMGDYRCFANIKSAPGGPRVIITRS